MAFEPVNIVRYDADHYRVGAVHLVRTDKPGVRWEARPNNDPDERPLFTALDLEGILDMAHGAVEMTRPAKPTMSTADSGAIGDWMDDHGVPWDAR